eukprot:4280269-Amphidinium_carterae.1
MAPILESPEKIGLEETKSRRSCYTHPKSSRSIEQFKYHRLLRICAGHRDYLPTFKPFIRITCR